jgi:hypothetical protein
LSERGGFSDELVDAIPQQCECGQRGNRDHQAGDRCDQRLIDAFGELSCAGVALRAGDFAKTEHHADDGAKQPEHGCQVGEHRQVFHAAEQPGRVLRERFLQGLLDGRPAAFEFSQAAMQHMTQEARLFMACLTRLRDAASQHQLPHLFGQRFGKHQRASQG